MKKRRLSSDTGNCNPPEIDATKLPAERLLKTSDLPGPKDAKLWEEVLKELPVDILLLTVKDCEFLSCVSHLNPGYIRSSHDNLGTVYFGLMGTGPTLKVAVMKCYPGPLAPGGPLTTVTNGVEVLRPKAVFCVGFCGGLGEEVGLGDVAILAKLRTYSSVKVTDSGIQERGLSVPLERNLLNLIKNADDGWKAPLKDSPVVKVWKDGVYLSGPEKMESEERREELVKRFPDAIAIEMEEQGLFLAAHDLKVEWIVIKGVANLADGRESESWREFASVMAASLTAHILSNPIVFENWPHYEGELTVPAEVRAQGVEAELAFQRALQQNEPVNVCRGRVMIVGQERAGKTSLKKSLLGMPFNKEEESTVGIEVDPSKFEVNVDQVINWGPIKDEKLKSDYRKQMAQLIAKEMTKNEEENSSTSSADQDIRPLDINATALLSEDGMELLIQYLQGRKFEDKIKAPKSTADVKLKEHGSGDDIEKNSSTSSADQDIPPVDFSAAALLSEDGMELLIQYLQGRKFEDEIKAEEFVINMWDFAGQHVYYASHPVFLSPRAVYILVYNLSKSLSAKAEPWVRQGATDHRLHNPNDETNLDNLLAWLVSVHSIRGADVGDDVKDADHQAKEKPGYLRPPVLIVGTHADQPFEDREIMKKCIEKGISGKKYQQQVKRPFFYVDNTKSESDRGVQELKNKIMTLFKEGSCKSEKLPLRWFHFEKVVDALAEEGKTWMKLDELSTVIKRVCHIEDEKELRTMLNFYHDLGVIVKHGQTVVLQAQWLINLFKQLITVPPFGEVSGILEIALVDHVFKDLIQEGHSKQDILDWMELYGLIVKFTWESKGEEETKYFVPAQLNSPPSALYKISPSESDPCPLYIHFPDGFVPHGLFFQLLSRCISWCSKYNCKLLPQLYFNGARLFIRMHSVFELVLICRKRFIKVLLRSPQQTGSSLTAASTEMANEVRTFLEATLNALTSELSWLWNLQSADLWPWVACSHCLQSDDQCTEHNSVSCSRDDCLHLLKVDLKEGLSCEKNFSSERVKVNGLEKWFEACKAQNEEDKLGYRVSVADDALPDSSSLKHGKVSPDDLPLIACDLVSCWKRFGLVLPLEERQLQQIEADEQKQIEKSYGVLKKWLEISGDKADKATYQCLYAAFKEVDRADLAAKYCDKHSNPSKDYLALPPSPPVKAGTPSDQDLLDVANEFSNSWKLFCRVLKLSEAKLAQIEEKEPDLPSKCHAVLKTWREQRGSAATYELLALALRHPAVEHRDLANKHCFTTKITS